MPGQGRTGFNELRAWLGLEPYTQESELQTAASRADSSSLFLVFTCGNTGFLVVSSCEIFVLPAMCDHHAKTIG